MLVLTKNICLKLCDFLSIHLSLQLGLQFTLMKKKMLSSHHLEGCHAKVTKHWAIEISNSTYNNKTPSEYCCQKHIATGKACHDDFIKLFISKVSKVKLTFFVANGDQIWNHCSAIVASALVASTFSILPWIVLV